MFFFQRERGGEGERKVEEKRYDFEKQKTKSKLMRQSPNTEKNI